MHIPAGLKTYFRAIAWLGLAAMIVDTSMSAMFGMTIGWTAFIGLAVVSLGSGLLLVLAEAFRRAGLMGLAQASFAVWIIAFAFNCWSNMGVATSSRMGEVQTANVQQAKYTESKKSTAEAEQRLKLFTGQLETLLAQHGWAATVSADGLRSKAEALQASEQAEARLGGCGPKCRAIQDQRVKVQEQIAVAEQRQDLTRQIEATKKVLADARTQLAGTSAGISATANQSTLYAKLISFNLASDPDASAVTVANESTGIAMAIVIAIVSAFLTLVGALPHLNEMSDGPVPKPMETYEAPSRPASQANVGPANDMLEALKEKLAGAKAPRLIVERANFRSAAV